jgi:hypothetical protein
VFIAFFQQVFEHTLCVWQHSAHWVILITEWNEIKSNKMFEVGAGGAKYIYIYILYIICDNI